MQLWAVILGSIILDGHNCLIMYITYNIVLLWINVTSFGKMPIFLSFFLIFNFSNSSPFAPYPLANQVFLYKITERVAYVVTRAVVEWGPHTWIQVSFSSLGPLDFLNTSLS